MSEGDPRPNEVMAKVAAPLYTLYFARMTHVANKHGYALGLHGSMARDLDVIAAPWTDDAVSAEELIAAFKADVCFGDMMGSEGTDKPHGRRAFNMHADCGLYIDVSVMPRQSLPAPMPSEAPLTTREGVCIHGGLRRQCETCDLAERLDALQVKAHRLAEAAKHMDQCFGEDGYEFDKEMTMRRLAGLQDALAAYQASKEKP